MEFKEQFVKHINDNLDSDVALMSISGMFGDDIKYYILGNVGANQYLCIWVSNQDWGVCTVVNRLINVEEPDMVTLGELCNCICGIYH